MKEALDALRPLHEPAPPPWWPPAPGWWLLLALGLMAVAWWFYRRWRLRLQRLALQELAEIRAQRHGFAHSASLVNQLLKRYALVCFPRHEVAGLSGRQWLRFLREHCDEHEFFRAGKLFLETPYKNEGARGDVALLFGFAESWIRMNRPGARR